MDIYFYTKILRYELLASVRWNLLKFYHYFFCECHNMNRKGASNMREY